MTLAKLASLIAKREGKKHQASIGDIREILKIFFDLLCDERYTDDLFVMLDAEFEKLSKKRKKNAKLQ